MRIICCRFGKKFTQWHVDNLKHMIDEYSGLKYDSFEVIDKSFSAILIEISSPSIAHGPAISKNLSFGISFKIIFNINYYFLFTSKNFPPSHLYTCPSSFKIRL